MSGENKAEHAIKMAQTSKSSGTVGDYIVHLVSRALFDGAKILPYETRVRFAGWVFGSVLGKLPSAQRRIRKNLAHAWPELSEDAVKKICKQVPNNFGRSMMEIYSGKEFTDRIAKIEPHGPGLAALDQAHADGRPIVLVSGHFGNYDAFRSCIYQRGHNLGALFRDMSNPYFNEHYVKAMKSVSEPMFNRGRRGLVEMVKFLKQGNTLALLSDQYVQDGKVIYFFGQPTPAAMSAAEMAIKYDAPLIPIYGIRKEDGLNFEVFVDSPIEHSDAQTMMQQVSDSLEAQVRKHPGQWLWVHKRWKPELANFDNRKNL